MSTRLITNYFGWWSLKQIICYKGLLIESLWNWLACEDMEGLYRDTRMSSLTCKYAAKLNKLII